ncbi:hydroxymethylbilane synthase [Zobellia uliginosa]|uniref:Hydroxymethylbilane synthase n=1 Tax=Zobellia uliginosa TaxID=143224 RepID=A0ABY1KHY7_9FLAO|nr:hydroxymethylbilane synthase [Zobellia uliginosa]SIS37598.1 hydroxymethylbilane synthase [Zobellia uliginosa]
MSKVIRIGTRDSELALWQANTVKNKLEALGHKTTLVPVKSTGDLVLDKPLYELGITGIFTKTLDVAMLNGDIDIAVHSMKDVPTALPKGIVQAAVLERANFLDILAFKKNEEFMGERDAIIATGSLRRKAQWLNRYPTHTVVDLRGNINSRYEKLENNDWNGAIFAAAGLERIGLEPENTIGLTWMVPAPAQGAIMVVAKEDDEFIREACAEINHEPTEICTKLEREFLRILEGGCSAPIGALATISKENEVSLKGVLLTVDGKKKLEAEFTAPLGKHSYLAKDCANSILSRGGKLLMTYATDIVENTKIFSTRTLTPDQINLFDQSIKVKSEDFIKISPNRISSLILKKEIQNVIITSQNTVEAILKSVSPEELKFKNIYCVGGKTKRMIKRYIGPVKHQEKDAKNLAKYLVEYMEGTEVTYFCSNLRLDHLPTVLAENNIKVREIEAYTTKHAPTEVEDSVEGIMFYSPSTITSYLLKNSPDNRVAYCIGDTTAEEARKHFKTVYVAKIPTVESVIDLVNQTYGKD